MKWSLESDPRQAGENSRRDFVQKLAARAAVTPVAGGAPVASATQQPSPMPMVRFGKHLISHLIAGCRLALTLA